MASSASSYFHRFWIMNTLMAMIFWWLFIFMWGLAWTGNYWEIFCGAMTLFGLLSFIFYYWKSWKYSITDSSFSAFKAGLRISLSWMLVWDIFLLWRILIAYVERDGICYGIMKDSPCSLWEIHTHDFETFIILWVMGFLLLLPILFSVTGLYLDQRKNKDSFPWIGITSFIGLIIFFIWVNIGL